MAGFLAGMTQVLLPKGKGTRGGISAPPGYNPNRIIMTAPAYRDHLNDLYNNRTLLDSRALLNQLVNQDPDVSAAVHSYLTIAASAQMVIYAHDVNDQIDPVGIQQANQLLQNLTIRNDYTTGFSSKLALVSLLDEFRYMLLLRGSLGGELILDKTYVPVELRAIDMASIRWSQPLAGVFLPEQRVPGVSNFIPLDIPTFFTTNYHQNPTDMYTFSPFVSAINTIAARTEVINELYNIMKVVGFPRLDVSVLEEVLLANAPPTLRNDMTALRTFVSDEILKVRSTLAGVQANQPFVHSSAIKAEILNDKNPGAGMQIQSIIDVLDSQNQAALKVMPAVIGKAANATTASTEARLFAMSADALNRTVGAFMSNFMTFGVRLNGYAGRVEVKFRPVELRPVTELEPQLTMRAARLKDDLSLGLISDTEYSMEMYGRPPIVGAPPLSGTGFLDATQPGAAVDTTQISPNSDSLGRSLSAPGSKSAKSNGVKKSAPAG